MAEDIDGKEGKLGGFLDVISKYLGTHKMGGTTEEWLLLSFIASIFLIAYLVPVLVYPIPTGTDVYTHMFYTNEMSSVDSLDDFYNKCSQNEYVGCDYPFGLWLFGSVVSKVTGIGIFELSYTMPLILLVGVLLLFYAYSGIFLKTRRLAILSVLFLISMPNISTAILGYSPLIFSISILLSILYFTFNKNIQLRKRIVLLEIFVFCLVISHTGTYVFLLSFVMIYLLVSAVLWGEFKRDMYILLMSLLLIYTVGVLFFPNVQQQYIDKTALFMTVGDFISGTLNLPFISYLSQLFYQRVFVESVMIDAILWAALFYVIIKFITFARQEILKIKPINGKFLASIPIIGDIRNISHSVLATPFWIGPIHSFFSLFGMFRLSKVGWGILISSMFVLLIPGGIHTGPTGALREIFYFLIIVPIVSALGFEYLRGKIQKRFSNKVGKIFFLSFLLVIFVPLIAMPTIGNIYYRVQISGTDYERNGMTWLGGIGNENEGVSGYGYRHMIGIYSNKLVPSITTVSYGTDMRRFLNDLKNIYFREGSEIYTDDIYTNFDIKYIINSEKVVRNLGGEMEGLKIDSNGNLDKVYASKDNFAIYSYIPPVYSIREHEAVGTEIGYEEMGPEIEDNGLDYDVETDYYRVAISKTTPLITYLGTKDENYLGDGGLSDSVSLFWFGGLQQGMSAYIFSSDLNYTHIPLVNNQIVYRTVLIGEDGNEWCTMIIKYTFYQRAFKREISILNDYADIEDNSQLRVIFSTRQFSPLTHFTSYSDDVPKKKRIYPSEDSIKLTDIFDSIFINDGERGVYFEYGKTSPYPDEMIYKGSTLYNYSSINLYSRKFLYPADSMHITQFISVGDEKIAKGNVEKYTSTSLLLYPEGKAPFVVTGYLNSLLTMDNATFSNVLFASNKLNSANVTRYALGIPMSEDEFSLDRINRLLQFNRDVIGYGVLYDSHSRFFESYGTQRDKIRTVKRVAGDYGDLGVLLYLDGFVPDSLNYNLATIRILDEENIGYMIGTPVRPPYLGFYETGLRYPNFAYMRGNETDVVILPISLPTSLSLRPDTDVTKTLSSWKAAIDASVKNDEMCLFVWNPDRIGMEEYVNGVLNVVEYAQTKGLSLRTPVEIERHFRLLQNISIEIFKGVDNVKIELHNGNDVEVKGVGFRVILPQLDGDCPYTTDGKIIKTQISGGECEIYVSVDVESGESTLLSVESYLDKKGFDVDFVSEIEYETLIFVKNISGAPVEGASVFIAGELFETDEDGMGKIEVGRGSYVLRVEKPGYETESRIINIKGKVYALWEIPPETYILSVVVLILLTLVYLFRQILYGHAVQKSKIGFFAVKKIILNLLKTFSRKS